MGYGSISRYCRLKQLLWTKAMIPLLPPPAYLNSTRRRRKHEERGVYGVRFWVLYVPGGIVGFGELGSGGKKGDETLLYYTAWCSLIRIHSWIASLFCSRVCAMRPTSYCEFLHPFVILQTEVEPARPEPNIPDETRGTWGQGKADTSVLLEGIVVICSLRSSGLLCLFSDGTSLLSNAQLGLKQNPSGLIAQIAFGKEGQYVFVHSSMFHCTCIFWTFGTSISWKLLSLGALLYMWLHG